MYPGKYAGFSRAEDLALCLQPSAETLSFISLLNWFCQTFNLLGNRQDKAVSGAWNPHLPGGVVTKFGGLSVPFVTSQTADFQNHLF